LNDKVDVQSIFDEQCIEFNSYEDEKEAIASLMYNRELEIYDDR
jgi:hypothetical protein